MVPVGSGVEGNDQHALAARHRCGEAPQVDSSRRQLLNDPMGQSRLVGRFDNQGGNAAGLRKSGLLGRCGLLGPFQAA